MFFVDIFHKGGEFMVKLSKSVVICKKGIFIFYGIKTARRHYFEISQSRKEVQKLVDAVNSGQITEQELPLFIEEMLS